VFAPQFWQDAVEPDPETIFPASVQPQAVFDAPVQVNPEPEFVMHEV